MKKQEVLISKSFKELENQPIKSDISKEFSEEDINRMALEDRNDDIDFSESRFMGIEELECFVNPKQRKRAISIRLSPDVLDWYKSYGPGYQTFSVSCSPRI